MQTDEVALAQKHYEKFRIVQDNEYISDFDKEVKKLLDNDKGVKK